MKSRFALPVVIALTSEAVLLLCFNKPAVAHGAVRITVASQDPLPLVDPEPPTPRIDSDYSGPANTRPPLPSIPEPAPLPSRTDITIDSPPVPQPVFGPADRVIPGIDGPKTSDGPGTSEVIPARLLDNAPRETYQKAPSYPYEAARDSRSGTVTVEFVVDEAGRVLDPFVVSSTDPVFEEPTLRAVSQWRFQPGRKDGRAVRFRMRLPVEFHPDGN
jgi:periplasmic protein TonB